ncbi:MAG: glycosyltransferase family 2 protein [Hyphomicrobium sp.]|nr:glycosyltransferase family 2 protein [Hyphomicrobium sp.]
MRTYSREKTVTGRNGIDISILIVSYNTREMTLEAISSAVRETHEAAIEIIVVDNASKDGSADAIALHPAKPQLIRLEENIGFGRANNLAAEYARGDHILLLNPDTVVLDSAIDRLWAFSKANRRALIWGGRTLFADGSLNPSSCWGRITLWNLACRVTGLTSVLAQSEYFNGESYGSWPRDTVREVDIVSGCFLMLPRPIWLALGGFDPAFFMYGEEADLCLRAKRIGARPMVTPDAAIIHHGGASETTRTGKMVKLLAAKATLIDRHFPRPFDEVGKFLLTLWPLTRWIAHDIHHRLTGAPTSRASAKTWREIWTTRDTWRFGYARPDLTPAEHAARNVTMGKRLAVGAGGAG